MSDNESISRIQIDLTGDQQAVQAINRLQSQADAANKAFGSMNRVSDQAARSVANIKLSSQAANEAKRLANNLDEAGKKASSIKKVSVGNVASALSSTASMMPGPVGDVARAGAQITQFSSALAALGPIAAAGGVAIGVLSIAMDALNAEYQKQKESLDAEIAARMALSKMRRESTSEQATQSLTDLFDRASDIGEQIHYIEGLAGDALTDTGRIAKANLGLDPQLKAQLDTYNELNKQFANNQIQIDLLKKAINENAFAANDAKKAESDLSTARKKVADEAQQAFKKSMVDDLKAAAEGIKKLADAAELVRKQAEQAAKDLGREGMALADLNKDRTATLAQQAEQDARDAQVGALEARIAQSKERDEQATHQDKLQDMRKEAAQKERDLGDGFMAESLKSLKAFQLSESRQTADYNLGRKRQMADLYRDLTDLASQRDVAGFITRQRQGDIDLARGAEDAGIGAGRRAQDFALANEERRQQFEQQLTEQRAQARAQVETERQAGQQRVTETAKLEQALADLRAQWAEADKQAQRAQEQRAYNERRTQLSTALALDAAILRSYYANEINQVKNFVQGAQAWIGNLVNYVQRGTVYYADRAATPSRKAITANDVGGIYDRPTIGMLGERPGWSDFVFPVKRGEGIGPALNRVLGNRAGMQVTYHDNRTLAIGNLASRADIDAALDRDRQEFLAGMKMAVWGASGIS